MRVRCQVPLSLFVIGPSVDSLALGAEFRHKHFRVTLSLPGSVPVSDDSFPEDSRHFRSVTDLQLQIEEVKEGKFKLTELVGEPTRHPELFRLLAQIVNRVLRSIRNFGVVAQVGEIHPQYKDAETYLEKWGVEFSEDGENWKLIYPLPDTIGGFAALFTAQDYSKLGTLRAIRWPDTVEAIQDNLEPGPEQEFLTNAVEHLERRNYRLALVESIVCLEIVLNDYLKEYLATGKGIPSDRIKNFLTPDIGLTARVSVLLDLTLSREDLKSVEIDHVLQAIDWRNKIVHKTGRLPEGIAEETIRQKIVSVFELAMLLAFKRDQIKAEPEMRQLSEALSKKHAVPVPNIYRVGGHRVAMDMIFPPVNLPGEEVLKALADDLSSRLLARDKRFKPNEDLSIRYMVFPRKTWARWQNGQLEVIYKTLGDIVKSL